MSSCSCLEQIRHITWIILLLYSLINFDCFKRHFYCLFTTSSKSKMMAQFHRVCHLDDCSSSVQRHYSLIACPTLKALITTGLMWYEPGHTETLYILNKQTNKLGKPSFPRFLNSYYHCFIGLTQLCLHKSPI